MANFFVQYQYRPEHDEIVQACTRAAKRRARVIGLRWRTEKIAARHLLIEVIGNTRMLDLYLLRLERDLPEVAEGAASSFSASHARGLGLGFADLFVRGRDIRTRGVLTLRPRNSVTYLHLPYDFDCSKAPTVEARLRITAYLLADWFFGEVAPEVLPEELHTSCELTLDQIVNKRSKRLSFAQLVDAADEIGTLDEANLFILLDCFSTRLSARQLLLDLKDLRKNVRHHAAPGAEEWLNKHADDVCLILEKLARILDSDDPDALADHNKRALETLRQQQPEARFQDHVPIEPPPRILDTASSA